MRSRRVWHSGQPSTQTRASEGTIPGLMSKSALIVWGGWDGHEPDKVADLFQEILTAEGVKVTVRDTLNAFSELEVTNLPDLIVPIWTMGEIEHAQCRAVWDAVADHGVGLAGCHGGMCDAFRSNTDWQFMTGGQWVAHPGDTNVTYSVHVEQNVLPEITDGLTEFSLTSEQYYLHTDPGNTVLAWTQFPHPGIDGPHTNNPNRMPQVWVKSFGKGKVFYNAIGHRAQDLATGVPRELMRRGFLWAMR